jgi:succinoglycan biosynthesis transport protein ExoP
VPEDSQAGEVDLHRYLRALRRRRGLLSVIVVSTVAGALALSAMQTTLYQAEAQVRLEPQGAESLLPSGSTPNALDPKLLIDTVEGQLGRVRKVSVSRSGETLIMLVRGQATTARRAAAVANAYARTYIDQRRQQQSQELVALSKQLEGTVSDLQRQIDALGAAAGGTNGRIDPATATAAARRDSLVTLQATFRQQLDEIQVRTALTSGGARLVAPATAPGAPIQPTPVRNAVLALLVAAIVGVSVAVLLEYLDDSIKSTDDVARAVGAVPVLGVIPSVSAWRRVGSSPLDIVGDGEPAVGEAYRALRTAVQLLGVQRPLLSIQITSAAAGEGKTTTLCNLAAVMAASGRRVVIIDCDLRRPRVHQMTGVSPRVGLTNVLAGETEVAAAVQAVPGLPQLSVLAAGPPAPNPSELLGSRRMSEVVFSLQSSFDVVLVDTPPALSVTDAVLISTWVEATVLVVGAGTTTVKQLRSAIRLLRQAEAAIVGVVLNKAEVEASYGYGYGYGYGRDIERDTERDVERDTERDIERDTERDGPAAAEGNGARAGGPPVVTSPGPGQPPPAEDPVSVREAPAGSQAPAAEGR